MIGKLFDLTLKVAIAATAVVYAYAMLRLLFNVWTGKL